jgi:hypothetical protein
MHHTKTTSHLCIAHSYHKRCWTHLSRTHVHGPHLHGLISPFSLWWLFFSFSPLSLPLSLSSISIYLPSQIQILRTIPTKPRMLSVVLAWRALKGKGNICVRVTHNWDPAHKCETFVKHQCKPQGTCVFSSRFVFICVPRALTHTSHLCIAWSYYMRYWTDMSCTHMCGAHSLDLLFVFSLGWLFSFLSLLLNLDTLTPTW